MLNFEAFVLIIFVIQVVHSIEEFSTGFHEKWYLTTLSFTNFLLFEIIHTLFWGLVIFMPSFPYRNQLLLFFMVLMFANGVQHLVWFGFTKKYVPGLITAPLHVAVFLIFYFQFLRSI